MKLWTLFIAKKKQRKKSKRNGFLQLLKYLYSHTKKKCFFEKLNVFFSLIKKELKGSLGNPKWFFYGITVKTFKGLKVLESYFHPIFVSVCVKTVLIINRK